jgi:predicted Zn-dependent peptidase
MEVWLLPRQQAPLVSIALGFPSGTDTDAPTRAGLTALTMSVMHEGVRGEDAASFAIALERLGGSVSVKPGRRNSTAEMLALSRNFDATFDLFADMLLRPTLSEPDFERVKAQQLAGIEQRAKDPGTIAAIVAARRLAEDCGRRADPATGYLSTVQGLSAEMVRARHTSLVQALGGARLVVCGDITREKLSAALERQFGKLPASAMPAREKLAAPAAAKHLFIVDKPDAPQTVIRFQHEAPALGSEQDAPLQLANTVFGGSFTSRLSQNLRERNGFTYGAGSRIAQDVDEGVFIASSNVRTEVTGASLREFLVEFDRLAKQDFNAEELAKAKAAERTDLVRTFEEVSATSGALLAPLIAGRGPGHLGEYAQAAASCTLAQVNAAAQTHMRAFPGVLVLVGDAKTILAQLEGLDLPSPEWCDADGALIKR